MRRTSSCSAAKTPRSGPPKLIGTPSPCPSPTTMSAPSAPGGVSRPRFTGSATTTSSAPAAWAISAAARTSSRQPKKFGYWTTTAAVCSDDRLAERVEIGDAVAERGRRGAGARAPRA